MSKKKPVAPFSFLTDRELAVIEGRNAVANRLRTKFGLGPPGESELERLVAEVRHWRSRYAPRKLSPAKAKKWEALIRSIKADAASGRVVTLITLSVRDMEDTARRLTVDELRNVRFTFFGLSLAPRKDK